MKIGNKMRNIKINWKRGSGELLGFVLVVPIIILMIYSMISVAQISAINQRLASCVFTISKSSAQEYTYSFAESNAEYYYRKIMGTENQKRYGYDPVSIQIEDGKEWKRGTSVTFTVRYYIPAMFPFKEGIREQHLTVPVCHGIWGSNSV